MNEKKEENNPSEKMPFEQAMQRLEGIVQRMEAGEMPLEQMVEAYEEGRRLLDLCAARLNEVEKKIELLEKNEKTGEWTAHPFEAPTPETER